ncbi:MAG TPA: hypothetical protein VF308_11465, partial [Caldimonas sp.]
MFPPHAQGEQAMKSKRILILAALATSAGVYAAEGSASAPASADAGIAQRVNAAAKKATQDAAEATRRAAARVSAAVHHAENAVGDSSKGAAQAVRRD